MKRTDSLPDGLYLMFVMLSISEIIIGVNEASSCGKGFSLFLLQVLSSPSRSDEMIRPSSAMRMSLFGVFDVFDVIYGIYVSYVFHHFNKLQYF